MMNRILGLIVAASLVSSLAVAGEKEDKEEAKRLFESGLKLMKVDDFAGAAANFERSSALFPTQTALFNLANCHKALQRYGEALDVLKRLQRDFGGKLKPEIKESAAQQEAEIRSVVATLVVKVEPAAAKVAIDGRDVGAASSLAPLLLAPGDHTIEASHPGHRTLRRSVRLFSGIQQTESFSLATEPGYLMVRSEPIGAVVSVDGREMATTPMAGALVLPPGAHTVALRMTGHRQIERKVEILPGGRQAIQIVLPALDGNLPPVARDPGNAADAVVALSTPGPEVVQPKTRVWKILAWSTSAGTLVAGGTALVFWKVLADGHFEDAKEYDAQYANSTSDTEAKIADTNRHDAYDLAVRDGKIAAGCGIGAGALAVAALVSFLADSGESKSAGSTSVSLSPYGVGLRF